jgi:hypothetical protein
VGFEYADESDRVRYPIPRGVHIEGRPDADGDRHALLVDRSRCRLYELFALRRAGGPLDRGLGRDMEPAQAARAARGLDERRRGRAADPAAARPRWDNDQLRQLGRLRGSDFEVVEPPR